MVITHTWKNKKCHLKRHCILPHDCSIYYFTIRGRYLEVLWKNTPKWYQLFRVTPRLRTSEINQKRHLTRVSGVPNAWWYTYFHVVDYWPPLKQYCANEKSLKTNGRNQPFFSDQSGLSTHLAEWHPVFGCDMDATTWWLDVASLKSCHTISPNFGIPLHLLVNMSTLLIDFCKNWSI